MSTIERKTRRRELDYARTLERRAHRALKQGNGRLAAQYGAQATRVIERSGGYR